MSLREPQEPVEVASPVAAVDPLRAMPPAVSPDADLVARLLSITKSVRVLNALHLEKIDLHAGQDQFIDILGRSESITVGEAALILNVRPSTVSKMADRLMEKGLAERLPDTLDSRRTRLRLTTEGKAIRAEVHAVWLVLEEELSRNHAALRSEGIEVALRAVDEALTSRLMRLR